MQTEIVTLIIAGLSVAVAWLSFRVAALSRKESRPNVNVEWRVPAKCQVAFSNTRRRDLACLLEGLFTNTGERSVSVVELVPSKAGFAYLLKLAKGKRIEKIPYDKTPRIFLLSKPVQHYLSGQVQASAGHLSASVRGPPCCCMMV